MRKQLSNQGGLTLLELVFATLIAVMGISVIVKWVGGAQSQLLYVENRNDLISISERIAFNVNNSVSACSRMFNASDNASLDFVTDAYVTLAQASLTQSAAPVAASFCQVPRLYYNTDPPGCTPTAMGVNGSYFGDSLLFAATAPPISVTVKVYNTAVAQRIDCFQFVYIYLAQIPTEPIKSIPGGRLALMEWRSVPLPNAYSINSLAAPALTETAAALVALGYKQAWDPTASTVNAFYDLTAATPYIRANPLYPASPSMPTTINCSSWGEVCTYLEFQMANPSLTNVMNHFPAAKFGGVGANRPSRYSIAYNTSTLTSAPYRADVLMGVYPGDPVGGQSKIFLPQCATALANGFPAGFEVMITGQPAGRELCGRVTVMSDSAYYKGSFKRFLAQQNFITASFRDAF